MTLAYKRHLLLTTLFSFSLALITQGQYAKMSFHPKVVIDGDTLEMPWTGGLNQPQFSQMDMNEDGLMDMFVFDRSGFKKMCFIAVKDGSQIRYVYDPIYEDRFPEAKEFMVLKDIDGDQIPDLWFNNGSYTYLSRFQSNNGNGFTFKQPKDSLVAFLYFDAQQQREISRTLGQYSGNFPGIDDVDFDGDIDYLSNGDLTRSRIDFYQNTTLERTFSLKDTQTFENPDKCFGNMGEGMTGLVINAKCDFDRNYSFNKKHSGTKTIMVFDNDGDGDSDMFFGNSENLRYPIIYFENGKSDLNMKIDTFIRLDTSYFARSIMDKIPIAPAGFKVDVDNDGVYDLILATNESYREGVINQTNQVIHFKNKGTATKPDFEYVTNDFIVGDMIDLGGQVSPTLVDIDGDNDFDLIVASNGDQAITQDSADRLIFFENVGNSSKPIFKLVDDDFLSLSKERYRVMKPCFGDITGNGKPDLILGTANQGLFTYINNSTNGNLTFAELVNPIGGPFDGYRLAPFLFDIDKDGALDLVLGEEDGNINLYLNKGNSASPNFVLEDDVMGDTLVNEVFWTKDLINGKEVDILVYANSGCSSPVVADLEGDGNLDLISGTIQGTIMKFTLDQNKTSGKYSMTNDFFTLPTKGNILLDLGSFSTPAVADLDGDDVMDFVIGNNRGGLNFFEGSKTVSVPPTLSQRTIQLYPNPSASEIHLVLPSDDLSWYVVDGMGRLMISSNESQTDFSVSSWQDGIYFLTVYSQTERYHTKFAVIR